MRPDLSQLGLPAQKIAEACAKVYTYVYMYVR